MIQLDLPFPAPEAPRWRPILTAPRVEGRRVLLLSDGHAMIGYWSDDPHGDPYARRPGWLFGLGLRCGKVTHWIPIPEAPK